MPMARGALVLGTVFAGVGRPVTARSSTASATSAPLLYTVGVGRDPVALAVDARTSRVFVLDRAGSVTTRDATRL